MAPKQLQPIASQGIPKLVIPEFVPAPAQPVNALTRWFDNFFMANLKINPDLVGRNDNNGEMWVNTDPRLTALSILTIKRTLPITRTNSSGWVNTHEICSIPRTTGPDMFPVLRIADDRHREDYVGIHITIGDDLHIVDRRRQQNAHEIIQPIMDQILADLAYKPTGIGSVAAA